MPTVRSSPIRGREAGLAELVGVDHVADQRARGIRLAVELRTLKSEHGEYVAVWLVACGRARASPAWGPEIGAGLQRFTHLLSGLDVAEAARQAGLVSGNIHHQPVPPPAAGRRIRIVNRDREAPFPSAHSSTAIPARRCPRCSRSR